MNIILPGESGVSKYDDDPNAPLYIEDKDIKMTKEEKKHWMAGDDVPAIQATDPWSMRVDDANVDKDYYKQTLEMPQQPANQILTLGKADFNQNINNLTSILQDILAGDTDAMKRPEFNALNFPAIKAYLEWAIKTNRLSELAKCDLMSNAWRLNFKCRPPTPEEFLTEKFIGAQAEALHPWLRDTFVEFFDPLKPYRTLILTQHIGSGKSTMTVLLQLYISVHYAMMWHPYRFFGMAMSSIFTQCLGGWNQKKASELLLEPFTQILEGAPYFQRVKTHQNLVEASAGEISDCIHWTSSAPTSALSMQNGVNYKIINGPGSILGQNIISAAISELTMFSENGWALDLNTDILMKDKTTKKLKDLKIGDELAHPENKENKVEAIPYKKLSDQFKITLDNGKTVLCHRDHIWKVSYKKDREGNPIYELVTTQFMIEHPELEFDIPEVF